MHNIYVIGTRMHKCETQGRSTARRPHTRTPPLSYKTTPAAGFLFTLLHFRGSALFLLAILDVTGEDEVVVVEVGQLAVQAAVALEFLTRRENAATFGALMGMRRRK